jgi:hypothetical protein
MYEKPEGLWAFGTWVNGGHWSTCEARMMLGYYRLGQFEDARQSMRQLLSFAERFRMDNPLVKFGSDVYQPGQPINLTYDAFGPPAAFVRGLFEYLYRADELTLLPHIPPGITSLTQRFPIRFGSKELFLATVGTGPITAVALNGQPWTRFDSDSVRLPYEQVPKRASIEIARGGARLRGFDLPQDYFSLPPPLPNDGAWLRLKQVNLATNGLPLRIGADSDGKNRFGGEISRVRIFNRALSTNEIATLARSKGGSVTEDSSLAADWSFESLDNGTFVSKSTGHLVAKPIGKVDLADGPAGKVLRLDGSGYLEVARHSALDLSEACTLEAWIRPEQLPPGGARIIDKSEVGTSNGFLLDTHPGNSLRLISQAGTLSHDARLAAGKWVHVAATVAPDGQLALYFDGRLVAHKAGAPLSDIVSLLATGERLRKFHRLMAENGLDGSAKAAHARLAWECLSATHTRLQFLDKGKLKPLASTVSQAAADWLYLDTVRKLADGLDRAIVSGVKSADPKEQKIADLWRQSLPDSR